jgi:predicted nucleotidyltransferase
VRQVILFGSLAKKQFTAESDIDLTVAGLASEDFFMAYAEINRLSRFRIDCGRKRRAAAGVLDTTWQGWDA